MAFELPPVGPGAKSGASVFFGRTQKILQRSTTLQPRIQEYVTRDLQGPAESSPRDNKAISPSFDGAVAALAVKLIEAQEAAAKVEDAPSQGTPSVVSDSEDGGSARGEIPMKTSAVQPRFLSFSQLSNIDWNRLANSQEWRTVLQLKGLAPKLCRREALEALLEAHGLKADVQKVRTSIKPGGKFGSAVLHATSTEAVSRVCRFFHGRQFAGSRIPISVSFADGK
ncbi:unnamed protein product, partial [Symbiodinium sp. KB8]